jgi:hypothetical protein
MRLSLGKKGFFSRLEDLGYCAVWHPEAGITPLQLFEKDGSDVIPLNAQVDDLFDANSSAPLPKVQKNTISADISGQKSNELNLTTDFDFSLFSNVVSSFISPTLNLMSLFKNSSALTLNYNRVLLDKVNILDLDKFLDKAKLNLNISPYFPDLLESGKVFVMTTTAKSKDLTASSSSSSGFDVKTSLEIQSALGPKIQLSRTGNLVSAITFKGEKPLIFAFKVRKIIFTNGKFMGTSPEFDVQCE